MPHKTFIYIIVVWVAFAIAGILLDMAFRTSFMLANLGAYAAHVANTIVFTCFILFVVYRFIWSVNIHYHSSSDLLFIGFFWFILTIFLEFAVDYYYRGVPWETLAEDYNIFKGRLRGIVPLSELVAPYLFGSIRRSRFHQTKRPKYTRKKAVKEDMKMKIRVFLYALGVWLIFVVAAILNGGFRSSFVTPRLGEYAGHVISSAILICFTLAVTYVFIRRLKIQHNKAALFLIGIFWFVLTVLFEFIFGHYVMGQPWSKLFADYNAFEGRLWSFVLLSVLVAPYLCGAILSRTKKE